MNEDEDTESGKDTKKYEKAATEKLNRQINEIIKQGQKSITIVVNGQPYPGIVRAEVVPGSQNKSDINLINSKEEHVIFISHKDVGGSKRFARWGSFQYLYGKDNEVNNFKNNIYTFVKNKSEKEYSNEEKATKAKGYANIESDGRLVFSKKASFSQKIASDDLKKKLVFGEDFGKGPGLNNVQLVVQGDIVLKEYGEKPGVYEFDSSKSENVWFNGELPSGQYEPVLHVHYRGESKSRGTSHNELGIENCETMSKPISSISGPDETRSLWDANEVLDPNVEIPKRKVEIDKKDSVPLKQGGRAASEDWINSHKKYKDYFNLSANPIQFPGKKGIFYTLKPDSEIQLVKKED